MNNIICDEILCCVTAGQLGSVIFTTSVPDVACPRRYSTPRQGNAHADQVFDVVELT